jgi:SNF2 family DNA or RNA helicase
MVCDEAQKIKNPIAMVTKSAKKQNVRFKVACTGTPVENSLVDLWCLFDFIQPGYLGALAEFKRLYISDDNSGSNENLDFLRSRISSHILRRTKSEVAKDLPNKLIDEECQSLPISAFQRSVYSQALSSVKGIKNDEMEVRSGFKTYLELLHYLRKICTHPVPLNESYDHIEPIASYKVKSPKIEWLINQLRTIKAKNEKVIVFCEFRAVQVLLRHYITAELGFKPEIINGDTSTNSVSDESRQKKITTFQNLQGFAVIILSPIAVGFGVNIQSANHVIHYMRTWNPAKEDQATDRAYRIGQTRNVYVYYPTVTATDFVTFDQRLNQLLAEKRAVADDILCPVGELKAADFNIDNLMI